MSHADHDTSPIIDLALHRRCDVDLFRQSRFAIAASLRLIAEVDERMARWAAWRPAAGTAAVGQRPPTSQ